MGVDPVTDSPIGLSSTPEPSPRADRASLLEQRHILIREINDLTRAFEAGYAAYIDPAIRPGERFLLSVRMDATQDAIKAKLVELGQIREALSAQAAGPEAVVA